jgi:hypothetical protein
LGVTTSKKLKNARLLGGIIYVTKMREKNSNLEKISLPESPFIKMAYHVRCYMTFKSNELGSALIMA